MPSLASYKTVSSFNSIRIIQLLILNYSSFHFFFLLSLYRVAYLKLARKVVLEVKYLPSLGSDGARSVPTFVSESLCLLSIKSLQSKSNGIDYRVP